MRKTDSKICAMAVIAATCWLLAPSLQADDSMPAGIDQFDAAGRLEVRVNEEKMRSDFVIVDEETGVEYSVLGSDNVDLEEHVGRVVGVNGLVRTRSDRNSGVIRAVRIAQLTDQDSSVLEDAPQEPEAEELQILPTPNSSDYADGVDLAPSAQLGNIEGEAIPEAHVVHDGRMMQGSPSMHGGQSFDGGPIMSHGHQHHGEFCPDCAEHYDAGPGLGVSGPFLGAGFGNAFGPNRQGMGSMMGGWYARADYLLWYHKGMYVPPLVTTSIASTPANVAGVLGARDTRVLYGGTEIHDDVRSGLRLRLGKDLDQCGLWGAELDYFVFDDESSTFLNSGEAIIARPIVDVTTGRNAAQLVQFIPGQIRGYVQVDARSEFHGGGLVLRRTLCQSGGCGCSSCQGGGSGRWRFDIFGGYRYLQLDESITIQEQLNTANSSIFIRDSFAAKTEFHGVDIGGMYAISLRDRLSLELMSRVAIGSSRQVVEISGSTTNTTTGAGTQVYRGGFLAQRSNSGRFKHEDLAVVPELSIAFDYQFNQRWSAKFGYNFIYWSNVVRPGDHISLDVNPDLFPPENPPTPGLLRPAYKHHPTNYYAHGLTFGLELRM